MLRSLFAGVVSALIFVSTGFTTTPPPAVSKAIESPARHEAEASAKRAQLDRARAKGLAGSKSWAPDQEPSSYDVTHYDLHVYLDPDRQFVSGTVEMHLAAVEDHLTEINVDAGGGMRITAVSMLEDEALQYDSPRALLFEHSKDVLTIQAPRSLRTGEKIRILIAYGGSGNGTGDGIIWSRTGTGEHLVWTFAEPFGARNWFPCNDRPDDKATIELHVTAPDDLVVGANGIEEDRTEHADGTATSRWVSQYPVATYLVVMNVSDFTVSELTYEGQDGTTMPVVTYATPAVAEQAEIHLANTPEMIETLAEYYGEYPFIQEKYGNCTVPFGGGMEHQTLTSYSLNVAGNPDSTWAQWLNVHELAHQWWGDWVTCADWRDLWLNEGFATVTEWLWAEHLGEEVLQDYLVGADANGFFFGPVYDNPTPFSGTVYDKGAWVLRMMRHFLGDEQYYAAVADYRDAFPGGAATSAEFQTSLENSTGEDLQWFFDQWVYGENRPKLHTSWQATDGPAIRLTFKQKHTNASLFRIPLDIRVTTVSGQEDHRIELQAVAEQTIDIPLNAEPTGVVFDPDNWVLCDIRNASEPDLDFGADFPGPFFAGVARVGVSPQMTVPLTNLGEAPLEIAAWGFDNGNGFSITGPATPPLTVQPNETIDIEITYRASGAGLKSDWLWVASNDPSREGIAFTRIEGRSALFEGPFLMVDSTLNIGTTFVHGIKERSLSLINMGDAPLTVSSTIENPSFRLVSSPPAQIEAGGAVSIRVAFSPDVAGDHEGMLQLVTNDSANPNREITLRGKASSAPHIGFNPAPLALGLTTSGFGASVWVSNTGDGDLIVEEVLVDGDFEIASGWDSPVTIPSGSATEMMVTLGNDAEGAETGTIRLLSNDPILPWAVLPVSAVAIDSAITLPEIAVPAAASTAGLGGGWWSTDCALLNSATDDVAADIFFYPDGQRGSGAVEQTVTIPGGSQRRIVDIVKELGHTGAGGLALTLSEDSINATTRTAASTANGSYGQAIGPVPVDSAQTGGQRYLLPGLASGNGFHSNFGVLNLGTVTVTVRYDIHAADGQLLGDFSVTALPQAFAQRVSAIADLSGDVLRGAWAEVSCNDDDARFTTYASVVDDGSHDPTFIPPKAVGDGAELLSVPVAAANAGLAGTRWVTAIDLINLGPELAHATVHFLPADGSDSTSVELDVPAGASYHAGDLLREVFDLSPATGWVQIESSQPLHGACRIFNTAESGTYGQSVPILTEADAFSPGTELVLPGLRSDSGFRTNLGVTSFADIDGALEVNFFADDGSEIGTSTVNLPAGGFVQLVEVLKNDHQFEGSAWATISTDAAGGPVAVHASIIDGSTGDPAYIAATAASAPGP